MKSLFRFWNELRRRNVPKGIISYVVFSWVLLQVISVLDSLIEVPDGTGRTLLITLLVLFPIWVTFSWFYDITPEGLKRTASRSEDFDDSRTQAIGKKLNVFILVFLTIAVILLAVDRFRIQQNITNIPSELSVNSNAENSIVVLPFRDLSLNKDQEYFADGLAEELLNSLTRISQLQVTSRTSAFSFKNKDVDIPTIADQLKVNYIIEGSVRTSDSLLRISIQLIDTRKDKGIWSQTWDRKMKNIFEIQNSIALSVANNLKISIADGSIPKTMETDPEAYSLYLKSKYWQHKNSNMEESLSRAHDLIDQSIAIDSSYAPSWTLLSNIYRLQALYGFIEFESGFDKAKNAALKSLELEPNYALAYRSLSNVVLEDDWDFKKAEKYINKALELEPNNALIIDAASTIALAMGDIDKAISLNELSVRLDPVSVDGLYNLSVTYYYSQQFDKAFPPMRKSLELESDQVGSHYILSLVYIGQANYSAALKEIQDEPVQIFKDHALSLIYWGLGDKTASEKALNLLLQDPLRSELGLQIAQIYAFRGEIDKAFEWLDIAIDAHASDLVDAQHDPLLRPLHNDPRWQLFLKKMNFVP